MAQTNTRTKEKPKIPTSNTRNTKPKTSNKPKISKRDRQIMHKEFLGGDDLTIPINSDINIKEDELEKYFTEATNNENPAKELFEVKGDIRTRTELSKLQIACITKLNFVSDELNFPELKRFTDNFMHLMVSHERKSRKEFVETVKGERDHQQGGGFFNKFGNIFNRNG